MHPTSPALKPKVVSISVGDRAGVLARRDALVEAHLDLVRSTAERVARNLPPSFDIEDLIGVGQLALLHAATAYRPEAHNGAPFEAFARPRVYGAMIDSARRRNYVENTRPSIDTMSDALSDVRGSGRIDDVCEGGYGAHARMQLSSGAPSVVECIDAGRKRMQMKQAVQKLSPRHRHVIQLHYNHEMTLVDIAAEMKCSASLASHLHIAALRELREVLDLDGVVERAA